MTKQSKVACMGALLLACVVNLSKPACAALTVTSGKIDALYADPSDFVVQLDTAGVCGSKFFHFQRANQNFKELTAIALMAFSTGKNLSLFVDQARCVQDRNIVSHGRVDG
jgi:hypothetical protein